MPMAADARFKDPLLNDAFDFSRYPTFKTRNPQLATIPYEPKHRGRGRSLFTYDSRGSPSRAQTCWRSRNVSEPLLISSTNYMRESWFTNFASSRTVGDIANLSSDDEFSEVIQSSRRAAAVCDTPTSDSGCGVDSDNLRKTPWTISEDSCEISGNVELSDDKSEEDSLYSMDSADQDAHPLLLSMPVIPQIKLERKATVRKPEPEPLPDTSQSQSFLSPRIRDLRTPARKSSRRYGRILTRAGPQADVSDVPLSKSHSHGALAFHASRRSVRWRDQVKKEAYTHSVSEPMLGAPYVLDGEEEPLLKNGIDELPHSDVLLSMIEDTDSYPGACSNGPEPGIASPLRLKEVASKHSKRHQRSSVSHSISFSSIVHAVADGCASLDLFLRKSKTKPKPKSTTKFDSLEPPQNVDEPTSKWAPKGGQIAIKVFVPSTDDIWMFRVPQNINLADFSSRVVAKLGFSVSFSGSLWDEPRYYFRTDEQFKAWVEGRIRFRRNLPIVAHVLPPLPLVRLSVDAEGCEVWCYA